MNCKLLNRKDYERFGLGAVGSFSQGYSPYGLYAIGLIREDRPAGGVLFLVNGSEAIVFDLSSTENADDSVYGDLLYATQTYCEAQGVKQIKISLRIPAEEEADLSALAVSNGYTLLKRHDILKMNTQNPKMATAELPDCEGEVLPFSALPPYLQEEILEQQDDILLESTEVMSEFSKVYYFDGEINGWLLIIKTGFDYEITDARFPDDHNAVNHLLQDFLKDCSLHQIHSVNLRIKQPKRRESIRKIFEKKILSHEVESELIKTLSDVADSGEVE